MNFSRKLGLLLAEECIKLVNEMDESDYLTPEHCDTDDMAEAMVNEVKQFTHKIQTGPFVRWYAKMLHKHYPNVNVGTEHVYVHTDHPAEHVANTLTKKLGLAGFKAHEFRTQTHSKPTKVLEAHDALVHGKDLSPQQHKEVLSAFVLRHTGEHAPEWGKNKNYVHRYKETHATDKDWVHDHSFHITNDGNGKLSPNSIAVRRKMWVQKSSKT